MNPQALSLVVLAGALFAPAGRAAQAAPAPSARLRTLAAEAHEPSGWVALRQYAATAGPGEKALAYLVLGYREYEAKRYPEAERDLEKAAQAKTPLAGFAAYYWAASLHSIGRHAESADLVANFSTRFPNNPLGEDAVALHAQCLTESGQAEHALQVLSTEPSLANRSSLLFAKARALQVLGRQEEAVAAFEEVYCRFPNSHESAEAETELGKLRSEMGSGFREPSPNLLTARGETLFAGGHIREALTAYNKALETHPSSPEAPRWKVGRARCYLRLRESEAILDSLQAPFTSDASMDAERLAVLAEAYAERGNAESMRVIVQQLGAVYPKSPAYAEALASAAGYYRRRSDWKAAEPFFEILANSFPGTPEGDEARWQIGWTAYLEHRDEEARAALISYVSESPTARHVPDALYWLARLAESGGASAEARTLYQTLAARFPHSYFAGAAGEREKALLAQLPTVPVSLSNGWAAAAELPKLIPLAPPPPPWLCASGAEASDGALATVVLLESLSLGDLAEAALKRVAGESASPELYMTLGRLESRQGETARSLLTVGKAFPRYEDYDFSRTPKELWEMLFPRSYWSIVHPQSEAKGISPYLVMGLIRQESAFNPNARSVANARGLMQVLPSTASPRRSGRRLAARRLADASYNVRFGSSYLEQLLAVYHGVPEYAVAAYHAGKANVDEWLAANSFREPAEFMEAIPIPATRIYVEHVLRDSHIYRTLIAGEPAFRKCP